MIEELKLFLGIQIHQSPCGNFINQAKHAQEILKNNGMTSCDSIGTPMVTKPLDADLSGTSVDQMKYHSMVEALMYLTASRPDIVHATCYYAYYQAIPTEKHLKEVKRIFWYLKNTINMGLWWTSKPSMRLYLRVVLKFSRCELSSHIMAFTLTKYPCIMIQRHSHSHLVQSNPALLHELAGLFTKALPEDRFKCLVRRLGMRCLTLTELEVLANETA
ncbi:hypothetical protein Tco_1166581 [Tanacetum coccineum]